MVYNQSLVSDFPILDLDLEVNNLGSGNRVGSKHLLIFALIQILGV